MNIERILDHVKHKFFYDLTFSLWLLFAKVINIRQKLLITDSSSRSRYGGSEKNQGVALKRTIVHVFTRHHSHCRSQICSQTPRNLLRLPNYLIFSAIECTRNLTDLEGFGNQTCWNPIPCFLNPLKILNLVACFFPNGNCSWLDL